MTAKLSAEEVNHRRISDVCIASAFVGAWVFDHGYHVAGALIGAVVLIASLVAKRQHHRSQP